MRVCLVCIAKNEDYYIKEWVEYHLKLGFDKIYIFENDWTCKYENEKIIKKPYNGKHRQVECYNEFLSKNKTEYDWAAFFDVDEFLVLKKHKNIKDFLNDYENYPAIGINWVLFGDNGLTEVINNNYSLLQRFTKRQNSTNSHIKTITKLNHSSHFINPHCLNSEWYDTNKLKNEGPFNKNTSIDIAQLNHYFSKTIEEFNQKINRGRANSKKTLDIKHHESHNFNEIEDLTALNFMYNDNNNLFNT
jgi:hypothetical protein